MSSTNRQCRRRIKRRARRRQRRYASSRLACYRAIQSCLSLLADCFHVHCCVPHSCNCDCSLECLFSAAIFTNPTYMSRSRGYYFASACGDNLAALWCTERVTPVRLFADHHGPVHSVHVHPNCNYVATGSADRCVRLFDVLNGQVTHGEKAESSDIPCMQKCRLCAY